MKKIKKENKQVKAKLMPIGKDGKEVDWFYGWPGIEKLTKSLGKSWIDVGELIENTWGDRTSMTDINFAHVIYHSLEQLKAGKWAEVRRRSVPINEGDVHVVIRMNRERLQQLWLEMHPGKKLPKDIQKSFRQIYQSIMKRRAPFVKAMQQKPLNKENY
jgi:hypothetical protein